MSKRLEEKPLEEALAEFEDAPAYKMPRRRQNLVLITLRVPQDTKKRLSAEARKRGAAGYTAVARELIERGLRSGGFREDSLLKKFAEATADEVITRLRRRRAV